MAWAVKQRTGSSTRKAVLLSLANAANHVTGRCDPSIRHISIETELGETAIKSALKSLTDQGIIERKRKRNEDGTLGAYRYFFPKAGDAPPQAAGGGSPQAAAASLNQEEDPEPGRGEEPSVLLPRLWAAPASVDRIPVTEKEVYMAREILGAWNDLTGQSLRSKDWLSKIIMRIREYPEATIQDHRYLIERNLAFPWWKGAPTPSVIYGNGAQFERSVMTARQAEGDHDRIERVVNAVIERGQR